MLSSKNSNSQLKQKIKKKHSQELIFKSQDIRKKILFPALGIFSIPIAPPPVPLSELMHTKIAKKNLPNIVLKKWYCTLIQGTVPAIWAVICILKLNTTSRLYKPNGLPYYRARKPTKQATN